MSNDDIIRKLNRWGCDTGAALQRVGGDEKLYLELLIQSQQKLPYNTLARWIRAAQADQAFNAAHRIKSTLGDLGLTPMYSIVCEMLEVLRIGSLAGTDMRMRALMEKRQRLLSILNSADDEA